MPLGGHGPKYDALPAELLACFSIGTPVGLAIYLAWACRGWAAQTQMIGLTAASGGALVGAWLGFHTIEGVFALVTTIVGTIVGANLLLLGLDIAWDRQSRDRFAVREALEARASTG